MRAAIDAPGVVREKARRASGSSSYSPGEKAPIKRTVPTMTMPTAPTSR